MQPYHRQKLSENVYFTSVTDPKFKRNCLSVRLFTPHGGPDTAANAMVPFLLRKGCAAYPDFTLLNQRLCELYDAVLSTDVSLYGESQTVVLSLSTLDDRYALEGDRVVEGCAELLCDILTHPVMPDGCFPREDFLLERQQLLDAIDAEMNDKRRYALMRYVRSIYAGELSSVPRYGSREAVAALTEQDVSRAYRQLLDTAAVELIFVGGGDPAPALEQFRAAFAGDRPRTPLHRPKVHVSGPERQVEEHMPVTQTKLVLGYSSGIGPEDPLEDAARVLAAALGGIPSSLLFSEVREKLHLCYYCSCGFDRQRGVLTVDCGIEEKNREQAQEAVGQQLRRLREGDYPDSVLEAVRLALIDSFQGIEDSVYAMESYVLSRVLYGGRRELSQELEALTSVSREQIAAAACRLTPDTVYCLSGNGEAPEEESDDEDL